MTNVLGDGGASRRRSARRGRHACPPCGPGRTVYIAFLSLTGSAPVAMTRRRQRAARRRRAARRQYSVPRNHEFLGFPDNRLDRVDLLDIVQLIEGVIEKIEPRPSILIMRGDLNIDHAICHRAVLTACRPLSGSEGAAASTRWRCRRAPNGRTAVGKCFIPNRFVDISATIGAKRRALDAYAEEMRTFPASAFFRGARGAGGMAWCKRRLAAAEAFMVLREIEA